MYSVICNDNLACAFPPFLLHRKSCSNEVLKSPQGNVSLMAKEF